MTARDPQSAAELLAACRCAAQAEDERELYRLELELTDRRALAASRMAAAQEADDADAWHEAAQSHDDCDDALAIVREAIEAIEGRGYREYERQVRSNYYFAQIGG